MATGSATWNYRDARHERFGRTHFRRYGDGLVSSLGLGTYLGEPTDDVDEAYRKAIGVALESGCNVVDTAINYRCQRSERVVGRALKASDVDRDAVLVATKGGFLPFDGSRPDDPGRYVREEYVETGLVEREDLVMGSHCIAPEFLDDQIDRSRANLENDPDLYYIHNPETQLREHDHEIVYDRLEESFVRLEERAAAGDLGGYGVATWEAFRVPQSHDSYLALPEVVDRARRAADRAGTGGTHFRAIQLPFNVSMADAFTVEAHPTPDGEKSVLEFAADAGLAVFTSASIGQGALADRLPEGVAARLNGETPAQRAINFARSAPGVTASLVGMRDTEHVRENLRACEADPMGAAAFDEVFE